MGIDSYFTIGSSHKICQDYARHEMFGDAEVIVVSDGCSTAKDTDIGARLISKMLLCKKTPVEMTDALNTLEIPRESLLCTLLSAKRLDDETEIFLSGDGFCVVEYDWGIDLIEFGSEDGAPYYLAYTEIEELKDLYIKHFGNENYYKITKWKRDDINMKEVSVGLKKFIIESEPYQFFTIANNYKTISLFSDGLKSFTSGKQQMTPLEAVQHFLDIKVYNGEFVFRTCRRALKDLKELGFVNHDDFAMATIYKG